MVVYVKLEKSGTETKAEDHLRREWVMNHATPKTLPDLKKRAAANEAGNRPNAANTRAMIAPIDHATLEETRHNATMCRTLNPLRVIVQPRQPRACPPREMTRGRCLQIF